VADPVDQDGIDLDLKFKHGLGPVDQFANITKTVIAEHFTRCKQIGEHFCLTGLRGVHHRRIKHRIIGHQFGQQFRIVAAHISVPGGQTELHG